MKNVFLKILMKNINKKQYTDDEIEIIKYGYESVYITITKILFIIIVSLVLNIFKEVILFLLIFNVIRTFAFGIHATKSSICLISSTLIFIGLPYILMYIELNNIIKLLLGVILIIYIFLYSPADTYKRPIINKKRRYFFKYLSTLISIIYIIISLITNNFISNCFLFSILLECIFISPITYKIFNLPYNNYLKYKEV